MRSSQQRLDQSPSSRVELFEKVVPTGGGLICAICPPWVKMLAKIREKVMANSDGGAAKIGQRDVVFIRGQHAMITP